MKAHAFRRRVCALEKWCRVVGTGGQDGRVLIGTWNLEGRWSPDHLELLLTQGCDVWLLTEVRDGTVLPGFESHLTSAQMGDRKRWSPSTGKPYDAACSHQSPTS